MSLTAILRLPTLSNDTEPNRALKGLRGSEYGPLIIAIRPILPTARNDTMRGYLVFGRLLKGAVMDRLRRQTELDFTITERSRDLVDTRRVRTREQTTISHALSGINGESQYMLELNLPRSIVSQGITTIGYSLGLLFLTIVVVLITVHRFFGSAIVQPLRRLQKSMVDFSISDSPMTRFRPDSGNELDQLSNEFVSLTKRLAESLKQQRQADQQLQQAHRVESLGTIAAGVAHDFNNLLSSILGHAELITNKHPLPGDAGGHMDAIIEAANQAAGLTDQMLTYAGRGSYSAERVQLQDTVGKTLRLVRPKLREQRIDLDFEAREVNVLGDPVQLS